MVHRSLARRDHFGKVAVAVVSLRTFSTSPSSNLRRCNSATESLSTTRSAMKRRSYLSWPSWRGASETVGPVGAGSKWVAGPVPRQATFRVIDPLLAQPVDKHCCSTLWLWYPRQVPLSSIITGRVEFFVPGGALPMRPRTSSDSMCASARCRAISECSSGETRATSTHGNSIVSSLKLSQFGILGVDDHLVRRGTAKCKPDRPWKGPSAGQAFGPAALERPANG